MRTTSLPFFFLILLTLGAGCLMARFWILDYNFETAAFCRASGNETALATSHAGDVDLITADDHAKFDIRAAVPSGPGAIWVSIQNLGTEVLSLDFADMSFVDASGSAHRISVFDWDAKLSQQRGVKVKPRSTVRFRVWPADWVKPNVFPTPNGVYKGEPFVGRNESPLGGSTICQESREEALARRRGDIGKSFELILPLGIGDQRISYRFRFTVRELVPLRTWWA